MRKDFTLMVYSVDGIAGSEAWNAEKRLATHLAGKWNREYSQMVYSVRVCIQLVDPLAIMHAVDESGGAKPLGSKSEMSTNMTVFLAYAPVVRIAG